MSILFEIPSFERPSSRLLFVSTNAGIPGQDFLRVIGGSTLPDGPWLRGDISEGEGRRVGVQTRIQIDASREQEGVAGGVSCGLHLSYSPLGTTEQPYDRSEGKIEKLLGYLQEGAGELDFSVLMHSHRSTEQSEPILTLPLPVPSGSLQGFSEVSGVHLTKREGSSADAPILFEVDLQRSGNLYLSDVQLSFRARLSSDLLAQSIRRAEDVLSLVFREVDK